MSQLAGGIRHLRILTLSLQAVDGVAVVCSQAGIPGPFWRVKGLHNNSSQHTSKRNATDCTVIDFNQCQLNFVNELPVRHAVLSTCNWLPKVNFERPYIAGAAPDESGAVFQPSDAHIPSLGN